MRWPWSKPRADRDGPDPEKAQRDLERLREQRPEVERLAHALRVDRTRNHYGETVAQIFRGRENE